MTLPSPSDYLKAILFSGGMLLIFTCALIQQERQEKRISIERSV